ncbi:hypothetical protein CR513_02062, partial [Mucuna pruriens]
MKDLGPANKILGMQIHRDRKDRKVWLSQKNYLLKILRRFNMQDCQFLPHLFMSPSNEAERMKMSRVLLYASTIEILIGKCKPKSKHCKYTTYWAISSGIGTIQIKMKDGIVRTFIDV